MVYYKTSHHTRTKFLRKSEVVSFPFFFFVLGKWQLVRNSKISISWFQAVGPIKRFFFGEVSSPSEESTSRMFRSFVVSSMLASLLLGPAPSFAPFSELLGLEDCFSSIFWRYLPCSSILICNFLWICQIKVTWA